MDSRSLPIVISLAFRYAIVTLSRSSSLSLMLRNVSVVRSVPLSLIYSIGDNDLRAFVIKSMSAVILLSLTVSS